MRPTWQERRRRIEAARAYAEIGSQDELGERIGFRPPKMRRYLGGDGEFTVTELAKIAEVCDVPVGFLLAGWEGAAIASALHAIEDDPDALDRAAADLEREERERREESDDATGTEGADD